MQSEITNFHRPKFSIMSSLLHVSRCLQQACRHPNKQKTCYFTSCGHKFLNLGHAHVAAQAPGLTWLPKHLVKRLSGGSCIERRLGKCTRMSQATVQVFVAYLGDSPPTPMQSSGRPCHVLKILLYTNSLFYDFIKMSCMSVTLINPDTHTYEYMFCINLYGAEYQTNMNILMLIC